MGEMCTDYYDANRSIFHSVKWTGAPGWASNRALVGQRNISHLVTDTIWITAWPEGH